MRKVPEKMFFVGFRWLRGCVDSGQGKLQCYLSLVGHFRLPLPLAFFTAVFSAKGFSLGIAA